MVTECGCTNPEACFPECQEGNVPPICQGVACPESPHTPCSMSLSSTPVHGHILYECCVPPCRPLEDRSGCRTCPDPNAVCIPTHWVADRNSPTDPPALLVSRCDCCDAPFPKRVYTLDADFDNSSWPGKPPAILQGVNHDAPNHDQLQLDQHNVGAAFPFVWVANSGESTVSKIDTTTGKEVARYYTGPPDYYGNYKYLSPSRTAVDLDGNCWVGNRVTGAPSGQSGPWTPRGSVTQILAAGGANTSKDCTPDGIIDPLDPCELLPWGTDDAVVRHYRVGSLAYVVGVRALAIDRDGFLWVGHWGDGNVVKLDPNLSTTIYAPANYPNANPKVFGSGGQFPPPPQPLCTINTLCFTTTFHTAPPRYVPENSKISCRRPVPRGSLCGSGLAPRRGEPHHIPIPGG